ncbi:meiotic recombination protein REC114 [Nematostella vectensis]|uniref:meiotic recombination protein REC114 n=1 Tax=Nematostella vectensis TaxID=45351 RepID=UPI00138FA7F2|nr:meiotic recombination protein REC114 [Nematostella vectensis]
MTTCKSWLLERYAKCVENSTTTTGNKATKWLHLPVGSYTKLQVSLVDTNRLVISSNSSSAETQNSQIHENLSLIEASKWLRVAAKGDCAVFLYRVKTETRRFRIRFAKAGTTSSVELCKDFVTSVTPYFPVREIPDNDTQVPMEDSQAFACSQTSSGDAVDETGSSDESMTVSEMARKVTSGARDLPRAYESTNLPTSRLNTMLRFCLTDPNFPAFVDAVERELAEIMR